MSKPIKIEEPDTEEGESLTRWMAGFALAGGVIAAICGGYANFMAFSGMADDPVTSFLWGFAGIAASLISFSAFTLVWWNHNHQKKLWDSRRALVVGLIAAGAGIMGSWMFMSSLKDDQVAEAQHILIERNRLQDQIDRWENDLKSIPPGIGTPDSIRRYMREVERVGRTHQRPYRQAIQDLGHAERREALEAQIAAADERLSSDPALKYDPPNRMINPWFLAILIELFASQGTAVGTAVFLTMMERKNALSWLKSLEEELGDESAASPAT